MRFKVLGPLEVAGRDGPIPLGVPLAVVAIDDAHGSVWVGAFGED